MNKEDQYFAYTAMTQLFNSCMMLLILKPIVIRYELKLTYNMVRTQ